MPMPSHIRSAISVDEFLIESIVLQHFDNLWDIGSAEFQGRFEAFVAAGNRLQVKFEQTVGRASFGPVDGTSYIFIDLFHPGFRPGDEQIFLFDDTGTPKPLEIEPTLLHEWVHAVAALTDGPTGEGLFPGNLEGATKSQLRGPTLELTDRILGEAAEKQASYQGSASDAELSGQTDESWSDGKPIDTALVDRFTGGAATTWSLVHLGESADLFIALGGNDAIFGGAGDDYLYGGEGDDLLIGGAGSDLLHGATRNASGFEGIDTAHYVFTDRIGGTKAAGHIEIILTTAGEAADGVIEVVDPGRDIDRLRSIEHIVATENADVVRLEGFEEKQLRDLKAIDGWKNLRGGDGAAAIDTIDATGFHFANLEYDLSEAFDQVVRQTGGGDTIVRLRNFEAIKSADADDWLRNSDFKETIAAADPLVLDLDGDGLELTGLSLASPRFDIDGDGFDERTGWVTGGDGLLARDRDGDGRIADISELFGTATESGFAALSDWDENADGVIDIHDAVFAELRVWIDADWDAVTDSGELVTLESLGIEELSLAAMQPPPGLAGSGGNAVTAVSEFRRNDGSTGMLADVSFACETAGIVDADDDGEEDAGNEDAEDPDGENDSFDFDGLAFHGGVDGGGGNDQIEPGAVDTLIVGGEGEDTVDYSRREQTAGLGLTFIAKAAGGGETPIAKATGNATTVESYRIETKKHVADAEEATDAIYQAERIKATDAEDTLVIENLPTAASFGPDGPPAIDFLSQTDHPTARAERTNADLRGDVVDVSRLDTGVVMNLLDPGDQYVAENDGSLRIRRYDPDAGLANLGLLSDIVDIAQGRYPAPGGYRQTTRIDLRNAENTNATSDDDIIVGLDFSRSDAFGRIAVDLDLGAGDDFASATFARGEIRGGDGDDVVYAVDAIHLEAIIDGPDRLTLDGGAGSDMLVALRGEAAVLAGGAGRDFIFNTARFGESYGGPRDGGGDGETDVFWFWPGTAIKDAEREDVLQLMGFPLLGGTNAFGVETSRGGLAKDWINHDVYYGATASGQLLVYYRLAGELGLGVAEQGFRPGVMVVDDYDYGGIDPGRADFAVAEPGDLGMVFRIYDEGGETTLSTFKAVWGHIITFAEAMFALAKLVEWRGADDPLVLDLDGDGLETVALDQAAVYFDLHADGFADRTGWLKPDDGFLVYDRDGDGRIADVTELFGAPGIGGYAELARLDDTGDGVLTADDAAFASLAVWRDLDVDGVSDPGELFSLAQVGIVSLDVLGTALGRDLASGASLRAEAGFTRADGTHGKSYEAIFEMRASDTRFEGDRGVAAWVADAGRPGAPRSNVKGFGTMTDLSVAMSNDFALREAVETAAAAMTEPDLAAIRMDAEPVFAAWAQSLETTRELTPVLVEATPGGLRLLDNATYVEDAAGGFWQLASGAPVTAADGGVIARPTLSDVLAQTTGPGRSWQVEQAFSPASRAEPLLHREAAPYLVEVIDGRATVVDFAIGEPGGSWRLASGTAIHAANGDVIAEPSRDDILALPVAEGRQWRLEDLGYNRYAELPVDRIGVQIVDGEAVDYTVAVTDAAGTFHVWARNLDRALELQHQTRGEATFALRNYAVALETLDEAGSTDDSAYRVEILTGGQLHFASSIYGIDFQPGVMVAQVDVQTGRLEYTPGTFAAGDAAAGVGDGPYNSQVLPAIALFGVMIDNYIEVSRGVAVRIALQSGLSDFARGLAYDPATDKFQATTDRELAPMFEAIFERAPAGAEAAYDYLAAWREILEVVYPDYEVDDGRNFVTGRMALDERFVLQMLLPAFETVGIDASLPAVLDALGVDERRLLTHDATAEVVEGTAGVDYIHLTAGDQVYRGGYGADVYFVGAGFGHDTIEDTEQPFGGGTIGADTLRFAHARSGDVRAARDGLDLVIEVLGTGDVLRVRNQFEGELIDPLFGFDFSPDTEMVQIVFADGVIWDAWDIARAVSRPRDADDLVLGSQARDILEGGAGNDILRGGRDGDIYIFRVGDGDDRIADDNDHATDDPDAKFDLLQFAAGIGLADLRLSRAGESPDLEIVVLDGSGAPTGDRVVIEDQFEWINIPGLGLLFVDAIERVAFEDGAYLSAAGLMARVLETASTGGADAIYGFNNADRLNGGGGDDLLVGRAQDDTYLFARGGGHDVIRDGDDDIFAPSLDTLVFEDGLRWSDFTFEREGNSQTVTMRVKGSGDAVTMDEVFADDLVFGFRNLIERIEYSDGTIWDHYDLARHVIAGSVTNGDDTIHGFDIADTLDGGAGDDRLEGGAGGDTYVFARGYGSDTVFDAGSGATGDRVVFRDIALQEVDISRAGRDLVFTLRDTGERLVVAAQYERAAFQGNAVETFVFSDATVAFGDLGPEDVDAVGTEAAETVLGSDFAETLDGRGGDDTLRGGSDGDTYLFDIGYGNDVIVDRQVRSAWFSHDRRLVAETDDVVLFGAGITTETAVFARNGDDLLISVAGHADTLTVRNQFRAIEDAVEWFEFADGSRFHASDISERLAIVDGSSGDDVVVGLEDEANVLDGREGDDRLVGGRLGDTYVFGVGYDLDEIVETISPANGAIDRVVLSASVSPDTVRFIRDGADLVIDIGNGTDRLTVIDGLTTRQVEAFEFSDGTALTLEDVHARLLVGTASDDILVGFDDRDDDLDGGAGSDALAGGLGNDTYRFTGRWGADSVADSGGLDRIVFGQGIGASMLAFSGDDGDLVVRLPATGDSLVIHGGAGPAGSPSAIERFEFADGTSLAISDVLRKLVTDKATTSGDVIDARVGTAIEIDPGPGDDLVLGGDGTTLVFRQGGGADVFDTTGQPGASRIHFPDLTAADARLRRVDLSGPDILIAFPATGDSLLVRGGLTTANLDEIAFADGETWSRADLVARAVVAQTSDRADVVTGSAGDDDISGGAGNDDIDGGFGDDIYWFTRGDGRDVLADTFGFDRLEIRGYTPDDVTVQRPVAGREDLLLTFSGTADEILLKLGVGRGVDIVAFGDGSEWSRDELEVRAVGRGTPFNDDLVAGAGGQTLEGGAGNDRLQGGDGSDTYVFRRGDGRDVIDDSGSSSDANRLVLRDYVAADVSVLRPADRPADLVLRLKDGDEITIVGGALGDGRHIAEIEFETGDRWTLAAALARLEEAAAGESNDRVEGTAGGDRLAGLGGDDTLLGLADDDTLEGGPGRDHLVGGDGSDVYVFRRGDGDDTVKDDGFGDADRIDIHGYSPGETRLARAGGSDLALTFAGTDDRIVIRNGLAGSATDEIETIAFDDGTVWSVADIRAEVLAAAATSGDDVLAGFATDDTLAAGPGDDFLSGGDGSDTYLFARGDSRDVILDNGVFDFDRIELVGYSPEETSLTRFGLGADLLVTFHGSGDRILVRDTLGGSLFHQIEAISFGDGTVWSAEAIRAAVLAADGTAGDDRIRGFEATADRLEGGRGNDALSGGDGSDAYVFHRGDGRDVIDDDGFGDTDVLLIDGYGPSETLVQRAGTGADLLVTFTTGEDAVLVRNGLSGSSADSIEEIRFGDGTLWSLQAVAAAAQTWGETLLTGTAAADSLTATLGNDYLNGLGGSDVYEFWPGGGQDRVRDNGFASTDRILLHGYDPADVTLSRAGQGGDLALTFAGSSDRIVVENGLSGTFQDRIEEIVFDDGTVWSIAYVEDAILAAESGGGDDRLFGFTGDDTLWGGAGDDILVGGDGSDIYRFGRGDGRDTVHDAGFLDTDVIRIEGYAPGETHLSRTATGDDLRITFAGTDDAIDVRGTLSGSHADVIERIAFDDGTVWTTADIAARLLADAASDGDDVLEGAAADDLLAGGAGDDVLIGRHGSDRYVFGPGDGRDVVHDQGSNATDRIAVIGYRPQDARLSTADDGASLRISFAGGSDELLVRNQLAGTAADTIEEIAFEDGTVWTPADIAERLTRDLGTPGDDRITGFATADTFEGGLGDDQISGGLGTDTYIYRRGDGYDIVVETAFDAGDGIALHGIDTGGVVLEQGAGNDLEILIVETSPGAADGGRITVRDSFAANAVAGIEWIAFDDGTVWSHADFAALASRNLPTPGDDRLDGTVGDDRIEGGPGNDWLSGGRGSDAYVFRKGDGRDTIREAGDFTGRDSILVHGYAPDEAVFSRRAREETDLVITLGADGDEIVVIDGLATASTETVEEIVFSDTGEVLDLAAIRARLVFGTPGDGDDTIIGSSEADTLAGLRGDDLLLGGGGDDTYRYQRGDGDDRIADDGGTAGDILLLSGILAGDVVHAGRGAGSLDDLVLRFSNARDRVTLSGSLAGDGQGVDIVRFADGAEWRTAEMRAAVLASATGLDDAQIRGFDGDDILVGGGGNDWLQGGAGSDVYRYAAGDGHDTVDDGSLSQADRLDITGIVSAEASVSRLYKASDHVVIAFAGRDGSITIRNALASDGSVIEEIAFADGVVWTPEFLGTRLDNAAPQAVVDGVYTVRQGETIALAAAEILANDSDPDGDPLSVIAVRATGPGHAQIDADGSIVFTAPADALGPARIVYTIGDGRSAHASASIDLRIAPRADARDDDGFTVAEDGILAIDPARLLSNDSDGDRMVVAQVLEAMNGAAAMASDGSIRFVPVADYNGRASFRYVANTPEGGRAEATVFIDVLPVEDAPTAAGDTGFSTTEGEAFVIPVSALLFNDVDADGDPLTVTSVTGLAGVDVALDADGVVSVVPHPFFFGTASFAYTLADPSGATATATVLIDVAPVNDVPEPQPDAVATSEDTPLVITAADLLANDFEHDGDTLTVTAARDGFGGRVERLANGQLLFTPVDDFFGEAHFFYTVDDGAGGIAETRVAVAVSPVNDAPTARDDIYGAPGADHLIGTEDEPLLIAIADLLRNDSDIDDPALTVVSASSAENGAAVLTADGTIRFTPFADHWGEATFRYVVTDPGGAVDDAEVRLYFAPVGDAPPVAADDLVSVFEDVPTVIPASAILANDSDVDRDPLAIAAVTLLPGAAATVALDAAGNIVFTPALNSTESVTIRYTVTDHAEGTDAAEVRVEIIPVADAPQARPDTATATRGLPLVVRIADLLANDSDPDVAPGQPDGIAFAGVLAPEIGAASVYRDEFIVVDYPAEFSGSATFTYTIRDETGLGDQGSVAVFVESEAATTLTGDGRRDLLIGGSGDEVLNGLPGDDDLFGGDGKDTLSGGDGADLLDGGGGEDTADYDGSNAAVRVDLLTGTGQGGHAQGDRLFSIEHLAGTRFADELAGDGGANVIDGREGNDLIEGREGADHLIGGAGDDRLDGGAGADVLDGGEGEDWAIYRASGAGVEVSLADATARGGDAEGDRLLGIENLSGSDHADALTGDEAANRLDGGRGDDDLVGGGGDDILIGGRGADRLVGGAGRDTADYSVSAEGVHVDMADGSLGGGDAAGDTFQSIEVVIGSFHDDRLFGDAHDNVFSGGVGADWIDGRDGFDTVDFTQADEAVAVDLGAGSGSAGEAAGDSYDGIEALIGSHFADLLRGSSGDEVFDGNRGDDILEGRSGSDLYRFRPGSGADTIIESGAGGDIDRIELAATVATTGVSLVREGDDLLLELEKEAGLLIDTLRVAGHFLGPETGIEEIAFADGRIWDRSDIDGLQRAGRFNAADDIVRFADEDEPLRIEAARLTANDSKDGGSGLTLVALMDAQNATVELTDDGAVLFRGAQDFNGDASFVYTVRDAFGRLSSARAEVDVRAANDAPQAVGDGIFDGIEDQPLVIPIAEILGNDFDVDGDDLVLTGWFAPLLGPGGDPIDPTLAGFGTGGDAALFLGQLVFTPAADRFGFAGFRYEVADPSGATSIGTVELALAPVNDAPTAANDFVIVRQGQTRTLDPADLLFNDSDPEGDAFAFGGVHSPVNGVLVVRTVVETGGAHDADRLVIDFTGAELGEASFRYDVVDAFGAVSTATVEIIVVPDNAAPNASADDGFTTTEDTPLLIDPAALLANDLDIDGDTLTFAGFAGFAENGHVALSADGRHVVFTPRADYNGPAGFTYVVEDGRGGSDDAFVAVEVVPANDPPVTADDSVAAREDEPLVITAAQVFANDSDPEGDVLFFADVEFIGVLVDGVLTATGGGFDVSFADERIDVALPQDFHGDFVLAYSARDGKGAVSSERARIHVSVEDTRGPPRAADDSLTVEEDATVRIPIAGLLANDTDEDGDALHITGFGDPTAGTMEIVEGSAGPEILFTPPPHFNGVASFTYEITDGADGLSTGRVLVTVTPRNDAPIAEDDRIEAVEDTPLAIAAAELLANDTDADGDSLSIVAVTDAENGTVALADGTIHFVPLADFDGEARFRYVVSDAAGATSAATVSIDVMATNRPPVAVRDRFDGVEDETLVVTAAELLANDADPDGDVIRFLGIDDGAENGQAHLRPDGSYALTPRENFSGEVVFTYRIGDGRMQSGETATLIVDFAPVNDAPEPATDHAVIAEDETLVVTLADLLANDRDVEGDPLTVVGVHDPVNGSVELNGTSAVFTPRADFFGNAGFSYEVSDGNGGRTSGFVAITVLPGNELPVAIADGGFTMDEDTLLLIDPAELLANDADPDGDPLRLLGVSGVGVSLDADGLIRYAPAADRNGSVSLVYTIADPGGVPVEGSFTVDIRPVDDDPVAIADAVIGTEDQVLVIPLAALTANDRDADGDLIFVTGLSNAIGGTASLDGAGNILFVPEPDRSGAAGFTYSVTDSSGAMASAAVAIHLEPVNDAPDIAPLANLAADEDTPVLATFTRETFSDIDGDSLSVSVSRAGGTPLPSWLTFDPSTLTLAGTPPTDFNGVIALRLTASDGAAETHSYLDLTIEPINDAPRIVAPFSDRFVDAGDTFDIALQTGLFQDVDADPLAYSLTGAGGSALPDWLVFGVDAGAARLSGAPPDGFSGTLDLTISASDGESSVSDTFSLTVAPRADNAATDGGGTDAPRNDQPAAPATAPAGGTATDATTPAAPGAGPGNVASDTRGPLPGLVQEALFAGAGLEPIGVPAALYRPGATPDRRPQTGDDPGPRPPTESGGNPLIAADSRDAAMSRAEQRLFADTGGDTFVFREPGGSSEGGGDDAPPPPGLFFNLTGEAVHIAFEDHDGFEDLLALSQDADGGLLFDLGAADDVFLSGTRLLALDRDDFTFF